MIADSIKVYEELNGVCDVLERLDTWGERPRAAFDSVLRCLLGEEEDWLLNDEEFRKLDDLGDGCGRFYEVRFNAPAFREVGENPVQYRAIGDFFTDGTGYAFVIFDVFKKPEVSGVPDHVISRRKRRSLDDYKASCGKCSDRAARLERNEARTREYQP